ncbi:PQQ-dependent sugar dehydrogenase [soil metagenome]
MASRTKLDVIGGFTLLAAFIFVLLATIACSGPSPTSEGLEPVSTMAPSPTLQANVQDPTPSTNANDHGEPPTAADDSSESIATEARSADDTSVPDPATPTETPAPNSPTGTPGAEPPTPTSTTPPMIATPDPPNASVSFEQIASGFAEPTLLTHAGDGSGTIYVTEKGGRIWTLNGDLFIDLTDRVINTGLGGNDRELGLLGLAFHPDFATNGYFYVHYNDFSQNTVISRFEVNSDGAGNPGSEKVLLTAEQSEDHFNGGTLIFGPDGYLYLALGTGGNLPGDHAASQDLGSIFGKILRIDVDKGDPYAVPPYNPFLNVPGARSEVWVYGRRNPWRFAFDRVTGDVYIAEPGQFSYEWVHFQAAGPDGVPPGGVNYGWPVYEGFHCFDIDSETASDPDNCDPPPDYQPPIFEYPRGQNGGCVIIGGDIYRGPSIPELQGAYLYSDFCSAAVSAAWRDEDGQWQTTLLTDLSGLVSSFGADEAGEIYVLDIGQGIIYKMVPA